MDMVFDIRTGSLDIDLNGLHPWGADIRAMLKGRGNGVANLRGVQMSVTVTADGETVFERHLPPPNVRYSKTRQDVIATDRVRWKPDQEIVAHGWLRTTGGREVTASETFTAPRPAQPYDSWEWTGTHWEAPVPYPDDGGEYQWDEGAGEWVEIDDDV